MRLLYRSLEDACRLKLQRFHVRLVHPPGLDDGPLFSDFADSWGVR